MRNLLEQINSFEDAITTERGRFVSQFAGVRLASNFQPIYSPAHQRIVGHEALLRASNGHGAVPTSTVFSTASTADEKLFLDRLCRVLHLRNYLAYVPNRPLPAWLFLNVSINTLNRNTHASSFFAEVLALYGFPAQRVVLEILEGSYPDPSLLADAVARHQDMGFLVALDDFGTDGSNMDRLWRVAPDIIKFDRSLIVAAAAAKTPKSRRILPALVSLVHQAGSLALIEGVETEYEANIALDSGADLVQGFYFCRPFPTPLFDGDGGISRLMSQSPSAKVAYRHRQHLNPYIAQFKGAAAGVRSGASLETACARLLEMPSSDRCYLIDEYGVQIGASVPTVGRDVTVSRFAPLEDGDGANWSRRPYHSEALSHPNEIAITQPYLSVTNSRMCLTLSMALRSGDGLVVFCCDIDWEESSNTISTRFAATGGKHDPL